MSKIIEKIVANCIFQHMTENGLHDKMQSAYKTYNSTETALLHVKNDILTALIDHSAAFDTVDHDILLNCLKDTIYRYQW